MPIGDQQLVLDYRDVCSTPGCGANGLGRRNIVADYTTGVWQAIRHFC